MLLKKTALVFAAILVLGWYSWAQQQNGSQQNPPTKPGSDNASQQNPPAKSGGDNDFPELDPAGSEPPPPEAPRSDDSSSKGGYSSSKDRKVDIGPPPPNGPMTLPNTSDPCEYQVGTPEPVNSEDDIQEMKPWDPHRADKNVEVGQYYFKQMNYPAAESRFREALCWQNNHAEAMYRLATVLEKEGKPDQARGYYESYLKILPDGEFAKQSKKSLARLDKDSAKKTASRRTISQPAGSRQ